MAAPLARELGRGVAQELLLPRVGAGQLLAYSLAAGALLLLLMHGFSV